MPNSRYQREIEEILSRMEESDPAKDPNSRVRPFRRPRARRQWKFSPPHIPLVETLLLVAILFILFAAGLAFYDVRTTPTSGIIVLVGMVLFTVALAIGWRRRFRPSSPPRWRDQTLDNNSRRGPFSSVAAQLRIWRLRQQYRRAQRDQGDLDD
jgi:hypothetical protein